MGNDSATRIRQLACIPRSSINHRRLEVVSPDITAAAPKRTEFHQPWITVDADDVPLPVDLGHHGRACECRFCVDRVAAIHFAGMRVNDRTKVCVR